MDDATMMTAADHTALQAELQQLEGEGRREIAERIRTAREWGDLKENSEYHDAKNEQAHLETRIALLRERLSRAQVVEAKTGGAEVAFGSTAVVRDEEGREHRFEIVASQSSAPAQGKLSVESPIARALIGQRVGAVAEVLTPRGTRQFTVLAVE